ncbi:MAG: DUF4258 domain-containing protein [Deltaproteobacteria bacterium]|nr:DUF4258 domain-containing protein [Deltaproteobacteria bacterium]
MDIRNIVDAIRNGRVLISDHADEEAYSDGLKIDEIYFSALHGEIIEIYPIDRPYPSCLVFGKNVAGDPIHSVWAFNGETEWVVLITVYRPDPGRWIDWRKRKK